MTENDQYEESRQLAKEIRNVEREIGHSRTILVGDLNMNPFEMGVAGVIGLHAVMSQQIARSESREIDEEKYPFFYNPMWNLFGDLTPGPPGTYYYDKRERYLRYYWHMFDQVLIRPALLDRFRSEEVRILTSDGKVSLISSANGRPSFSDHLPILFKLR
jgi:hypothetical protein